MPSGTGVSVALVRSVKSSRLALPLAGEWPCRPLYPGLVPADRNDTVVNLAKRRGFVFPSSEIYGGTRSAWDYGPLGVELKENVRRQWWRTMVTSRDDIVGLDSSVIRSTDVWRASGHLDAYTDPLVECLNCHKRDR